MSGVQNTLSATELGCELSSIIPTCSLLNYLLSSAWPTFPPRSMEVSSAQEVIEFSAHQMSVDHSSSFLVAGVILRSCGIGKIWKKRISDWDNSQEHPFFFVHELTTQHWNSADERKHLVKYWHAYLWYIVNSLHDRFPLPFFVSKIPESPVVLFWTLWAIQCIHVSIGGFSSYNPPIVGRTASKLRTWDCLMSTWTQHKTCKFLIERLKESYWSLK